LKRPLIAVKKPAPLGGEAGLEERLTCTLFLKATELFIFVVADRPYFSFITAVLSLLCGVVEEEDICFVDGPGGPVVLADRCVVVVVVILGVVVDDDFLV